jgi:hypothetical protein
MLKRNSMRHAVFWHVVPALYSETWKLRTPEWSTY